MPDKNSIKFSKMFVNKNELIAISIDLKDLNRAIKMTVSINLIKIKDEKINPISIVVKLAIEKETDKNENIKLRIQIIEQKEIVNLKLKTISNRN